MIEPKDVYEIYYYIKNGKSGNWESVKSRMNKDNLENIQRLSDYFNTKWKDINIHTYMNIGKKLWKGFGPKYFLHEKLIKEYIREDKNRKRNLDISHDEIEKSFNYIFKKHNSLLDYASEKIDTISSCVYDYLESRIDTLTISYLIQNHYLKLTDVDKYLMSYVVQRQDAIKKVLREKTDIFYKLSNKG